MLASNQNPKINIKIKGLIEEGNINQLQALYLNHNDEFQLHVNQLKKKGLPSFLYIAALNEQTEIFFWLLSQNENINSYLNLTEKGNNIFHAIAKRGFIDGLNKLEAQLTNNRFRRLLDAPNHAFDTPLHVALQNKQWKLAKLFLEKGTSVSLQDRWNRSAFLIAAERGANDLELLNSLYLEDTLLLRDLNGCNVFHLAAAANNTTVLEMLLLPATASLDALLEKKDFFGMTPIDVAIRAGAQECIILFNYDLENVINHPEYGLELPILNQVYILKGGFKSEVQHLV